MKKTIVLAWFVEDFKVVKEGRRDLGERPQLEKIFVPRAAVWLLKGDEEDLEKAAEYAYRENEKNETKMVVLVYPTTEKDPLGRAKKELIDAL